MTPLLLPTASGLTGGWTFELRPVLKKNVTGGRKKLQINGSMLVLLAGGAATELGGLGRTVPPPWRRHLRPRCSPGEETVAVRPLSDTR
jgi:hypothetical protein